MYIHFLLHHLYITVEAAFSPRRSRIGYVAQNKCENFNTHTLFLKIICFYFLFTLDIILDLI